MADRDLFGNEAPPEKRYRLNNGSFITESALKVADEETQMDAMRVWFFGKFQNPVEETPYCGQEGGYQYIHGGPYDAQDELESRFESIVPEEVWESLVRELENESTEWAGIANDDDLDEYLIASIPPPSEHIKRFRDSVASIQKLVKTRVESNEEQFFFRMLFASVITVLETYLSGVFVSGITNNQIALRKFVETFPKYRKQSLSLSDIFKQSDNLEREVQKELMGKVLWHRLDSVREMFSQTFDVTFPEPKRLNDLFRAVEVRHDLVHRSGMGINNVEQIITSEKIAAVIVESQHLVQWIDLQNHKFKAEEDQAEF